MNGRPKTKIISNQRLQTNICDSVNTEDLFLETFFAMFGFDIRKIEDRGRRDFIPIVDY